MSGRLVSYDALVIAFTHVNFTVGRNFTSSCHVSYLYWYSTAKSLQLLIYGACLFIITGPMTQDPKICHMVYFKLKELVQVQAGFSDLPLKQVMRPSRERRPPYTWRREHPDFLGHRTQRAIGRLPTLSSYPPTPPPPPFLGPITFFHKILVFIKTSIKTLRVNHFFGSLFPYDDSCVT